MTLAFPSHDDAVADIILIAWKRVDTLQTCLESLLAMTDAPPFGVRIAANGATAEVQEFLDTEVSGATVVELTANTGFGGGCNAVAAGSTAPFLVFLNDDTVVSPDWLTELIAAADPDTAVGSILLNTDGTLQEAGARALITGYTQVLGAGLSLDEAQADGLLTRREVDYASAAALLVPRARFEELGGFDLAYRPAYWEDVDLCFRFRAAGGRVMLQPSARVVHSGFGSVDGQERFRAFAVDHSHEVFTARWASSLESAPAQDAPAASITTITDAPDRINSGYPPVVMEDSAVLSFALDIKADFSTWLSSQIDDRDEQLERAKAEIARLRGIEDRQHAELQARDQRLQQAGEHVESLSDRVHALNLQVESLVNADPAHLLLWWRRARQQRRGRR